MGQRTAAAFAERLQEMALAMPQMCCSLYLQALHHPRQVRSITVIMRISVTIVIVIDNNHST